MNLHDNVLIRNGYFGMNLVGSASGRVRTNVVSANGIAKGAATAGVPLYAPGYIDIGTGSTGNEVADELL